MEVVNRLLDPVPLPLMVPVRQRFDDTHIEDVASAVGQACDEGGVRERIVPGTRVAIGVGSRGIANLPLLVKAVVEIVKAAGAHPFIVPAMGSHGGATAEGQQAMLEHLGVTESHVGAPILSTMEVVERGRSASGLPLYVDKFAADADGIILINRIKPHTSFRGVVESGLQKMMVIGLGKQKGADATHALGFGYMSSRLVELSRVFMARLPFLFGLGVVENAYDKTAKIAAILPERLQEEEPRLLNQARQWMPQILLHPLDVLVVDEIGKNISGTGMDPNITGRFNNELIKSERTISRIAVLGLTEESDGNASGLGLADATTTRAQRSIDRVKGYMNALTSTAMPSARLPMVLDTDRLAIQACIKTSLAPDLNMIRLVRIQNTLRLQHIFISTALLDEAKEHPDVEVLGPAVPMSFDGSGSISACDFKRGAF